MQLIPRYLVENLITIVGSESGLGTEFRPVYTRMIKVYTGIDNTIQFRLLNSDQKPIDITPYTPKFVAFNDDGRKVIERDGIIYQPTDSSTHKGKFTVTITENDLINLDRQYIKYNIYLLDEENNKTITYVDSHYDNNATILVDDYAFPKAGVSGTAKVFTSQTDSTMLPIQTWYSEPVESQPAINGSEALHTMAIYTDGYIGNVTLQATLNNTTTNADWADIHEFAFTGEETMPTPWNFNGVFTYFRVKCDADPTDKLKKVLFRN